MRRENPQSLFLLHFSISPPENIQQHIIFWLPQQQQNSMARIAWSLSWGGWIVGIWKWDVYRRDKNFWNICDVWKVFYGLLALLLLWLFLRFNIFHPKNTDTHNTLVTIQIYYFNNSINILTFFISCDAYERVTVLWKIIFKLNYSFNRVLSVICVLLSTQQHINWNLNVGKTHRKHIKLEQKMKISLLYENEMCSVRDAVIEMWWEYFIFNLQHSS